MARVPVERPAVGARLLDGDDVVLAELRADPGPYLVPAGILAEVASLVESRLGRRAMDALLADLESGAYSLDCGEDDVPRVRALAARYESLQLGFTDAAVIASAERRSRAHPRRARLRRRRP